MAPPDDLGVYDITPRARPPSWWAVRAALWFGWADPGDVYPLPPVPPWARTVGRVLTLAWDAVGVIYLVTITRSTWAHHGPVGVTIEAVVLVAMTAVVAWALSTTDDGRR